MSVLTTQFAFCIIITFVKLQFTKDNSKLQFSVCLLTTKINQN